MKISHCHGHVIDTVVNVSIIVMPSCHFNVYICVNDIGNTICHRHHRHHFFHHQFVIGVKASLLLSSLLSLKHINHRVALNNIMNLNPTTSMKSKKKQVSHSLRFPDTYARFQDGELTLIPGLTNLLYKLNDWNYSKIRHNYVILNRD